MAKIKARNSFSLLALFGEGGLAFWKIALNGK
jgi:hypothetical protein